MANEYTLVVCQDANFQSRSALIPAPYFEEEFALLRQHSKPHIFPDGTLVDQVIFITYTKSGDNCYSQVKTPYTEACNKLCFHIEEDPLPGVIDRPCSKGFDHVKNFQSVINKTSWKGKPIKIKEGFLILENTC